MSLTEYTSAMLLGTAAASADDASIASSAPRTAVLLDVLHARQNGPSP